MKKISCVIIDDEESSLSRLEILLRKFDNVKILFKSFGCENVVEKILQNKPDMVFLDIEMPDMSGFDIIEALRSQQFYPKFVLTTGHSQYAVRAIKKEAFDYLMKPVDIDDLRDCLCRFQCKCIGPKNLKIHESIRKQLTERESEVLRLSCMGLPIKQISRRLDISDRTVEKHRSNLMQKTGSRNIIEVIMYAYQQAQENQDL